MAVFKARFVIKKFTSIRERNLISNEQNTSGKNFSFDFSLLQIMDCVITCTLLLLLLLLLFITFMQGIYNGIPEI